MVTAIECGSLISETSDLIIRTAEKRARRGDNRPLTFLAWNIISDCWRVDEQQYSWNDLASYCRVRGNDNAVVRLARVVLGGQLSDHDAWRILQHAVSGMPSDFIAATLGGPTPEWWRAKHGNEIRPVYRLKPRPGNAAQDLDGHTTPPNQRQPSIMFRQPANGVFRLEAVGRRYLPSEAVPGSVALDQIARPRQSIIGLLKDEPAKSQTPPTKQYEVVARTRRRLLQTKRFNAGGPLTAKVTKYGALTFSYSAVQRFNLPQFVSCRLHYSESATSIGIEVLPRTAAASQKPTGSGGRDRGDRSVRRVYTTTNSAHLMVTSLLGTYGIRIAAGIECPVALTRDADGTELITVDLSPAIAAAARPGAEVPRRSGATKADRAAALMSR